ncbi:MAG: OmpA family protein [candidate division WOR-3 bacterium]|nr:OmpA family protein [candidate division WOR-3 bacterium]MCX7947879.1 OmpA family protein [candidate division WOR-3 bacterium]MDW8150701.1 OmpA family protein [candidate division WOR-3 bacterium]
MRFFSWFLILIVLLLLGFNLYFYYFEYLPLKKAFFDVEEENKKLIKFSGYSNNENFTKVIIQTDRIFKPGSDELTEEGKRYLDDIIQKIKQKGYSKISVESHTDSIPIQTNKHIYPTNWELAAHRATVIVRYFINMGIEHDKIYAVSYGDTRPISSNSTEEGRKQNRRIEIVIFQ